MYKIDFYQKIEGKPQAVFLIIYALDGKPWENYQNIITDRNITVPTCLMINRSDGRLGFVGGKVDEGETLKEALIREALEEIGFKIPNNLEPLIAHDIGHITTHIYALKLPFKKLKIIHKNSHKAPHFGSEITGLFIPHLIDYDCKFGKGGGISELIKSSLAPSVREELIHFLINKQILTPGEIEEVCRKSGHPLDTLSI